MTWYERFLAWWRRYRVGIAIVVVGLILINAIFASGAFRQSRTVNPQSAAQLGSFVGGYIGSIFSLIAIVLLYLTLISQQEASERQQLASSLQSFEDKYFELIKLHRDNVAETDLPSAPGRKLFVVLVRELRCALEEVRAIAKKSNQQLSQRELLHIAYYCVFFGVGPNSSRMLCEMLKISLESVPEAFIHLVETELDSPETKTRVKAQREFGYTPFEGHQSRLGHYYRHLYQMVRYVDEQTIPIKKYDYVKTIRAQLSTHEQALLLVNSLTTLGRAWWDTDLIGKYRLVKNIPLDFFKSSTELDVSELFEAGYFEWEQNLK